MVSSVMVRSRIVVLLLIMVMALAACGGSDSDDEDEPATSRSGGEPTATTPAAEPTEAGSGASEPTEREAIEPEATEPDATVPEATEPAEQVTLRLGVAMTPPELESFEAGLDQIRSEHPEWNIELETTPQEGVVEKTNAQIASGELPDVVEVQGLFAQPWIRQGAFADLTELVDAAEFEVDDFWTGALDQFTFEDRVYAVPNIVAPELVYYNKAMFDAAGVEYPTDDWTYEDLREKAMLLTLDSEGRNANDPDFDPSSVVQWGMSVSPNNIWTRHYTLPFGGDPCVNEDCTEVQYTSPEVQEAYQWWADLVQDGAAPYDPYTGNQTGVPGEGFQAGVAAMGINGFFLIGVLNSTGEIDYDIVEHPTGPAGVKSSPLSTNGWTISETSENKEAAWALIQELASPEFQAEIWARPGHGVPARRSASEAVLNPEAEPENQQAILDTLEYAEVFYPNTAGAFEVYSNTTDIYIAMMKGDLSVEEGTEQIDEIANPILQGAGAE